MENHSFNQIATKYDTKDRQDLAKKIVDTIKPELNNCEGKVLLDYGCGTGLVGLALVSFVDKLLLVDSSEQMLEVVREKIIQANITNAKVMYSDFTKTNPEIKADIIVASMVFHHISDTLKILKQFHSILNTHGKLIIVDFDKTENVKHSAIHNGFNQAELKSLLNTAGFKEISINTFYQGKKIFVNHDASLLIAKCIK